MALQDVHMACGLEERLEARRRGAASAGGAAICGAAGSARRRRTPGAARNGSLVPSAGPLALFIQPAALTGVQVEVVQHLAPRHGQHADAIVGDRHHQPAWGGAERMKNGA